MNAKFMIYNGNGILDLSNNTISEQIYLLEESKYEKVILPPNIEVISFHYKNTPKLEMIHNNHNKIRIIMYIENNTKNKVNINKIIKNIGHNIIEHLYDIIVAKKDNIEVVTEFNKKELLFYSRKHKLKTI